jgi:hypothetical protein
MPIRADKSGPKFLFLLTIFIVLLSLGGSVSAQPSIVGSGMNPERGDWPYTRQFQNVPVKFWLQVPPQAIVNRYGTHDYSFNARVCRPDGTEVWNTIYGFNEKGYCETSFYLPSLFLERSANRNTPDFGTWKIRLAVIEKESRRDAAVKDFPLRFFNEAQPAPGSGRMVVYLSDLPESNSGNIQGGLGKDRPHWQSELIIGGRKYAKGLVTHPKAENGSWAFVEYALDGSYSRFRATLGSAEDHGRYGKGTMNYGIVIDGRRVVGGAFPVAPAVKEIDLDIGGAKTLRLEVDNGYDGNNSDHAAWGEARLER